MNDYNFVGYDNDMIAFEIFPYLLEMHIKNVYRLYNISDS